ncbi:MAG TPA: hypothetical protein DCL21_04975 [Alphaproteobacteria bacterium]|nr:hypothetical protein [Alphaproteobacteria bacterium]
MQVYSLFFICTSVLLFLLKECCENWAVTLSSKQASNFILFFWLEFDHTPNILVKIFDRERKIFYYEDVQNMSRFQLYEVKVKNKGCPDLRFSQFGVSVGFEDFKNAASLKGLSIIELHRGIFYST